MNSISHAPHFARRKLLLNHTPKLTHRARPRLLCLSQPGDKSGPKKAGQKKLEGLPLSLYTPFDGLPPDGKTLTEGEESCNPAESKCKTPAYVYEDECSMCNGTGVTVSKSRGKRRSSTCTMCNGLGYVRRTTCRFIPDVNCVGPRLTINRQSLQNGVYRLKVPEDLIKEEPEEKSKT